MDLEHVRFQGATNTGRLPQGSQGSQGYVTSDTACFRHRALMDTFLYSKHLYSSFYNFEQVHPIAAQRHDPVRRRGGARGHLPGRLASHVPVVGLRVVELVHLRTQVPRNIS